MGSRRKARELALQAGYALELSGYRPEQIIETVILSADAEPPIVEFAVRLFKEASAHAEEFNEVIKKKAANWEFERIALIDRILLRNAICEFLYFDDIPPKVSIDEAIEIAKKYSTENSGRFINGILDSVLHDFRQQGRIVKSGRGLE